MLRPTVKQLIVTLATLLPACAVISSQPPTDFVSELTISDVHHLLQSHQTSCKQLIHSYIDRIERNDKKTTLNAITVINRGALDDAQAVDDAITQHKPLKPLSCVPVVVKDNIDTKDMPSSIGSVVFKKYQPEKDARIVKSLRDNGAIIVAKTNMGEWAFSPYETVSSSYGITKNAYDLSRVPAGSSGGTASAIAANFAIIGLGTDTGNSIRGPASHLALVGLRPTLDGINTDGVVPLLRHYDTVGPMTRTVTDLAQTLDVIAPPKDGTHYIEFLQKDGLKNIRIGVLRDAIDDTADFEIVELFEQALNDLQKRGATIVNPISIPNYQQHRADNTFCNRARFDVNTFIKALGNIAPVKSIDEIFQYKAFAPHSDGAMSWVMSETKSPQEKTPPCGDNFSDFRRKEFLLAVQRAMKINQIDAIVYPTWNNPPRKQDDFDSPHGNNSSLIAPHTGQPAITVPMGFTQDGLPTGLQILADLNSEPQLIRIAYAYEQATKHRKPPKIFPTTPNSK